MSRAVVVCLVAVGCYAPRAPEGAPCTLDRDCPSEQRCVQNACSRGGVSVDAAADAGDAAADSIDAPVMPTCPAFALLCDDFESGTTAKWTSKRLGAGATVMIDGTHAHSGTLALDATVPASTTSGAGAVLVDKLAAAQSTGVLALREWVFAPQPLINFSSVVQFRNPATAEYVITGGDNMNWVVSENSSAGLFDHTSMAHATESAWVCVEQDYLFDAGAPTIQLYVDDQKVIDAPAKDPMPAYAALEVGVARASTDGFHVFVDDVVIATQHIGCQ